MKKVILGSILMMTATAHAQVINDTVVMGAGYATNVWYSLEDDEAGTAPANNWDIALAATSSMTSPLTTALHINPKVVSLYEAVDVLPADFATVTAFDNTWPQLYNTDTSWSFGAFNVPTTPNIGIDYGFGSYNTGTHKIEANRVFVLQYGTNPVYKKMYITLDPNNGADHYIITYANLDNTDLTTDTLEIGNYVNKNFFYYDLTNKTEIDREPSNENWDLLFTQYTDNAMLYNVTGVLQNVGVEAVKVTNEEETTYNDFLAHTFSPYINTIGYDWKILNQSFTYDMADSTLYFVKALNGDIWKVVFTGFTGSSAGEFRFSKEKLATASVKNTSGKQVSGLSVYPNPANGGSVNIVYHLDKDNHAARLVIMDMTGRVVMMKDLEHSKGLHQQPLDVQNLSAGMYMVNIMTDAGVLQQKLAIR